MFEGVLIKESLLSENILDDVKIRDVALWTALNHADRQPKYWTAVTFTAQMAGFPALLSKVLGETWYVNMKDDTGSIWIVLKEQVLTYQAGDAQGRKAAQAACRQAGVPDSQLDWAE